MHTYVLARGQSDWLERWKNDVSAVFLPYEYKKGLPPGQIRIGVRPIQLLEIVYPEPCHDQVMKLISPRGNPRSAEKILPLLSKLLKLKPLRFNRNQGATIYSQFVSVTGIGCKPDERDKDGIELL